MAPTYDYPRKCELNECKQCVVYIFTASSWLLAKRVRRIRGVLNLVTVRYCKSISCIERESSIQIAFFLRMRVKSFTVHHLFTHIRHFYNYEYIFIL